MAIRHKRKTIADYTWQPADLVDGQLGINTVDGTLHTKITSNDVITIASDKASWKGAWKDQFYAYNSWVKDGDWGVIVTNVNGTTDRGAPQLSNNPLWTFPNDPVWNTNTVTGDVAYGYDFTVTVPLVKITGWRVWITGQVLEELTVQLWGMNNPLNPILIGSELVPSGQSQGWYSVLENNEWLIMENDKFRLVVTAHTTTNEIDYEGVWRYLDDDGQPAQGIIKKQSDNEYWINYNEVNSGPNRKTELLQLNVNDILHMQEVGSGDRIQQFRMTAQAIDVSAQSYVKLLVEETFVDKEIRNNKDIDFTWKVSSVASNTDYVIIPDGLLNYPSLMAKGFETQDLDEMNDPAITLNDNMYGVDLQSDEYVVSDDWDIVSYSGGASGSSGGETVQVIDDLTSTSTTSALSANMGRELNETKPSYDDLDHKRDKIAGIVGRGNSWLDFDFNTGELTLIPNPTLGLTEFTVWSYNTKYLKTNESIIIPTTDREYVVYYDNTGTLQTIVPKVDLDKDLEIVENSAIVARVTLNTIDLVYNNVIDLRYDVNMSPSTRNTFINTSGMTYRNGLALQNIVADGTGNLPEHAQFSVENGTVLLANIVYDTASRSQQLSLPAQIPIIYRYNTTWKFKTADDYPMIYGGSVGADYTGTRMPYNPIDPVTGIGDLVQVLDNDFVCVHYFATSGLYNGILGVQGQETYTTRSNARAGALDEINRLLVSENVKIYYTPIATVIYQTGNNKTNIPKAEIKSDGTGEDYIDLRLSKVALGTPSDTNISSFPEEIFSVYDTRAQKIKFNLANTDPAKNTVIEWSPAPEDVDFRATPNYKLLTQAATPLTAFQEISLDVNGNAQGYPASGGEGESQFVNANNVAQSAMVYASSLAGVVAYTTNNNQINYVVGQQQGDGSILWGNSTNVNTTGTPVEINGVRINATRICFCWVTDSGRLDAQILDVNIGGLTVTGGAIRNYEGSGITTSDLTYNTKQHIVFGYSYNNAIYNKYSETDNGTTLNDPRGREIFSTIGTPTKVQVTSEGENILVQYMNTTNDAYWIEAKWRRIFGSGQYDDISSARQMTADCIELGGVESQNFNVFGQCKKADGTWQSFYTNYTSGSGFGATATFGSALSGKIAKLVNSDSGLGYNLIINANDKLEVWEGSQSNPSAGFTKVYTSLFSIVSTAHNDLVVTMFESSWAAILIGDSSINNDIYFISSNITRVDNYIGNVEIAANIGDPVEIFLGLPVIAHAHGQYSAGDIFNLGPYKYQAISDRQIVVILEEITPI